jgi:hypothetical protein
MAEPREIRCYEYVNRPYDRIAKILKSDPVGLFRRATTAASERAENVAAKLKVSVAGFEIGKDVNVEVTSVDDSVHAPGEHVGPAIALGVRWVAASAAAFFPAMRAELRIYPLSADETQLDLVGSYTPPGGLLGSAADALAGHRIAQASVHRFLEEVAARLSADLA